MWHSEMQSNLIKYRNKSEENTCPLCFKPLQPLPSYKETFEALPPPLEIYVCDPRHGTYKFHKSCIEKYVNDSLHKQWDSFTKPAFQPLIPCPLSRDAFSFAELEEISKNVVLLDIIPEMVVPLHHNICDDASSAVSDRTDVGGKYIKFENPLSKNPTYIFRVKDDQLNGIRRAIVMDAPTQSTRVLDYEGEPKFERLVKQYMIVKKEGKDFIKVLLHYKGEKNNERKVAVTRFDNSKPVTECYTGEKGKEKIYKIREDKKDLFLEGDQVVRVEVRNADKKIIEKQFYDPKIRRKETQFFDSEGNLKGKKIEIFEMYGSKKEIKEKQIFDSQNNLKEKKIYIYDSEGYFKEKQVFDSKGNLVRKQFFNSDGSMRDEVEYERPTKTKKFGFFNRFKR